MKRFFISPFLFCLLASLSMRVVGDYYDVPMMDADWEVNRTDASCVLSQTIPNYGQAEFVQVAGAPLRFSIQEWRFRPYIIKADLAAMPSPWRHDETARQVHQVFLDSPDFVGDFYRLSVYDDAAEAMIDALLQGYSPTFTYVQAITDLDMREIKVAVSPIKFQVAYDDFSSCRKKLVVYHVSKGVQS